MVLAVLQARVSSTRLPGKVLKPLLGEPMLYRQIERLKSCRNFDGLVLATSEAPEDAPLAEIASRSGIDFFQGSLNDVLDRFYQAASGRRVDHVVRLTGDCPLADPQLIDRVIARHLECGADYTSNSVQPTYPDGLDVEVCSFAALEKAWKEATALSHREHVTLFIHSQPDKFRIEHFKQKNDLSKLRWTVDEPEDFEVVKSIYESLFPRNPRFTTDEILELLSEKPELAERNLKFTRNEGLAKSLLLDRR